MTVTNREMVRIKSLWSPQNGRQKGFTLLELLVVVAIIGILAAIAMSAYIGFQKTTKERAANENVDSAVRYVQSQITLWNSSLNEVTTSATASLEGGVEKLSPWNGSLPAFISSGSPGPGQVLISPDNIRTTCANGGSVTVSANTDGSTAVNVIITIDTMTM